MSVVNETATMQIMEGCRGTVAFFSKIKPYFLGRLLRYTNFKHFAPITIFGIAVALTSIVIKSTEEERGISEMKSVSENGLIV